MIGLEFDFCVLFGKKEGIASLIHELVCVIGFICADEVVFGRTLWVHGEHLSGLVIEGSESITEVRALQCFAYFLIRILLNGF